MEKCPSAKPSEITNMSPIQAITLARDIHIWYASHRRNIKFKEWDVAWIDAYDKCLVILEEGEGS